MTVYRHKLVPPAESESGYTYEYGPWTIIAGAEGEPWQWWAEDGRGNHYGPNGEGSDLEACLKAIHAAEDRG